MGGGVLPPNVILGDLAQGKAGVGVGSHVRFGTGGEGFEQAAGLGEITCFKRAFGGCVDAVEDFGF